MFKKDNLFNTLYPLLLGIVFFVLVMFINKKYLNIYIFQLNGFDEMLSSVINFISILIGFYSAMYGILLSLDGSIVIKKIRSKEEGLFKWQLYSSLGFSFIFLLLSIGMQIIQNYPNVKISIYYFGIWIFSFGYYLGSSYRVISLLLKIIFKETSNGDDNGNNEMDSREKRRNIDKINNGFND